MTTEAVEWRCRSVEMGPWSSRTRTCKPHTDFWPRSSQQTRSSSRTSLAHQIGARSARTIGILAVLSVLLSVCCIYFVCFVFFCYILGE